MNIKEIVLPGPRPPEVAQYKGTPENKWKDSCTHPNISLDKIYLVMIGGVWLLGHFSEQWYGLYFVPHFGNHTIQLNFIERVWETDLQNEDRLTNLSLRIGEEEEVLSE